MTGEPLFGGTDALDQITRIIQIRGPLPMDMVLGARSENRTKVSGRPCLACPAPPHRKGLTCVIVLMYV